MEILVGVCFGHSEKVTAIDTLTDLTDSRFEEGVGFQDFGADVPLDGGFEFGFRAGGESATVRRMKR